MALLTVDELRALAPTTLADSAVQLLLGAAEEAITRAAGPYVDGYEVPGRTDTVLSVHGPLLGLSAPASSVVSVTERAGTGSDDDLDAADYRLMAAGRILRRAAGWWRPPVEVVYVPDDDLARRKVAQADLVKLEVAFNPGLASQTVGAWTETYTLPGSGSYAEQRAAILATLADDADWGIR